MLTLKKPAKKAIHKFASPKKFLVNASTVLHSEKEGSVTLVAEHIAPFTPNGIEWLYDPKKFSLQVSFYVH